MDALFQLLGNYVFPVVACIGMFWYMIQKDKFHKEEINTLDSKHAETLAMLNNTLADNTKAINQLITITTVLSERLKDD